MDGTQRVSSRRKDLLGEERAIEPVCVIDKPVPSPITTSSPPSYSELMVRLERSDVML
jgi:hypothetical protein